MKRLLILLIVCLALAGCKSAGNGNATGDKTLTVSAAASLKDAFGEIAGVYKQQTGQDVTFNFGASGTLEKQIESGAGIDVFASAGRQQMGDLVTKQLIDAASRKDFARNDLVLIVPKDSKIKLQNLDDLKGPDVKRIATGNPKTVPAGQYSEEVFNYMQADDAFRQKLVLAEDVRQVLDYVVRGEVDAGLVYRTDAMIAGDKVKIVATAPDVSHAPITYPVAVIKDTKNADAAAKFVEILTGPEGQAILKKYGFQSATQ
jgi:molybdate transport system substrate-binding protein